MPFFKNSPPARAIMIEQGWPVYLFGSRQSVDAQLLVSSVTIASNVATVAVTSWSGPLPVVGAFASLAGTQTSSGLFNITNVAITAVTLNATNTDIVSLSFALTNANIGITPDAGTVYVRFAAIGEAITSAGGASIAGSVGNALGRNANGLSAEVFLSSGVTAATATIQGSNTNNDADFVDLYTFTLVSGRGIAPDLPTNFEFVRFNISGVTGSGTVWANIGA
jgi:hypothetical protein